MIAYLFKSGIMLFIFYTLYKLWLENEKMLRINRIYLLSSLVFSLLIPLQIVSFKAPSSTNLISFQLDEILIQKSSQNAQNVVNNLNLINLLLFIYGIIALALAIRFVKNLVSLYIKTKTCEAQFINGKKIVLLQEPSLPHSFWNTIFINKNEFTQGNIPSELIEHEKAHLDQNHSFDVLFVELLQIIFWFNPLIILYKKAIKLNHEFLADESVNKQFREITKYQSLLLDIASNKTNITLACNINYLITKKRLLMMTKKESPKMTILKVCSIGIITSLLLFTFSCKDNSEQKNTVEENKTEKSTVNLDQKSIPSDDDETVRNTASIEKKPEYPGGIEAFYKFVGTNFKAPDEEGLKGKVYVTFIVEKDGSLSDFKILRDIGHGTGEEAIRVLKLSPNWSPGEVKGVAVRTMYSLPITIQSPE